MKLQKWLKAGGIFKSKIKFVVISRVVKFTGNF